LLRICEDQEKFASNYYFFYLSRKRKYFLLCMAKHPFSFSQSTRGMELLIMCIPINSFGKWYNWAMVKFEPAAGDINLPVNAKGGYYDKNLYACKVLCFLKSKDDSLMPLCIVVMEVMIKKMATW